jgi:regulation of enolase protein 1 (concanavalin A-like superfamily)
MRKASILTIFIISILVLSCSSFYPNIQTVKAQQQFNDDFNSITLDSSWKVIDPTNSSTFSLTANPGYTRIISQPNNDLWRINSNYNAPRIEQQGITGNFVVETKVTANWIEKYECSGIYIWKDQDNFIRFERFHGNPGETIHFAVIRNRQTDKSYLYNIGLNPTYLKIIRNNDLFSSYYSGDGTNWISAFNATFQLSSALSVGLSVVNMERGGNFFADFDYFNITSIPEITPTPSSTATSTPSPTPSFSSSAGLTSSPIPKPTATPLVTSSPQVTVTPTVTLPSSFGSNWFNIISSNWSGILMFVLLLASSSLIVVFYKGYKRKEPTQRKLVVIFALLLIGLILAAAYSNYYPVNHEQENTLQPRIITSPTQISTPSPTPAPVTKITYRVGMVRYETDAVSFREKWNGPSWDYDLGGDYAVPSDSTLIVIIMDMGFPSGYFEIMEPYINQFYIKDNGIRLNGNYTTYWKSTSSSGGCDSNGNPIGPIYTNSATARMECTINGNYTLSSNYSLECYDLPVTVNLFKK